MGASDAFSKVLSCNMEQIISEEKEDIKKELMINPQSNIKWKVFYQVFNPYMDKDRIRLEDILTKHVNCSNAEYSTIPQKEGIKIFKEDSCFTPDGRHLVVLKWGEFVREDIGD